MRAKDLAAAGRVIVPFGSYGDGSIREIRVAQFAKGVRVSPLPRRISSASAP